MNYDIGVVYRIGNAIHTAREKKSVHPEGCTHIKEGWRDELLFLSNFGSRIQGSSNRGCGLLRGRFGCFGLIGALRAFAGSAHHELAAHEGLAMEHLGGALGVLEELHFHEGVALALVGAGVIDDFHAAHVAEALEEVFELSLGSLVGEVAYIEAAVAGGSHGGGAAALFASGSGVATLIAATLGHAYVFLGLALVVLAVVLIALGGVLLLAETEEAENALEQRGLGCGCLLGARHTAAIGTALVVAAAAGALSLPALRIPAISALRFLPTRRKRRGVRRFFRPRGNGRKGRPLFLFDAA